MILLRFLIRITFPVLSNLFSFSDTTTTTMSISDIVVLFLKSNSALFPWYDDELYPEALLLIGIFDVLRIVEPHLNCGCYKIHPGRGSISVTVKAMGE